MPRRGATDSLDLRVLRELMQGQTAPISAEFRVSYAALGRKLGVDEGTVRNRIKKLHRAGIVKAWTVIMNPRLYGGGEVNVWMDVSPEVAKEDLIEQVRLLDGTVVIANFRGTFLAVILRYADESSVMRQVELIRRLARAEAVGIGRVPFPDCNLRVTSSDWKVIKAICETPRRPFASVAVELGISSRTVRRKIERMVEGGLLFGLPWITPTRLHGGVMADLLVSYASEDKPKVDRRFASTFAHSFVHALHMLPFRKDEPTPCAFNLILPNVPAASEVLRWARRQSDILTSRIELFEDTIYQHGPPERHIGPAGVPLVPAASSRSDARTSLSGR